jgi:hypothetical protein
MLGCGDDGARPDPVPGSYALRTVNGTVLPWVTSWPVDDGAGGLILITDSVRLAAIELKSENHEFARTDSGVFAAAGFQSLPYEYTYSGTYAILRGDTVRFTATSGTFNNQALGGFGVFPDTTYGVLSGGRIRMIEEFFATERPDGSAGGPGGLTFQAFAKSYVK